MKTCKLCNQHKSPDKFYSKSKSKDGLDSWCKSCSAKRHKAWKSANKEKTKASIKRWASNNPEKIENIRLKKIYGITLEQYNQLLIKQNNSCAVCKTANVKLCVDHCHDTGKIRGLLCHACNKAAGFLKDSNKLCYDLGDYISHFALKNYSESLD